MCKYKMDSHPDVQMLDESWSSGHHPALLLLLACTDLSDTEVWKLSLREVKGGISALAGTPSLKKKNM